MWRRVSCEQPLHKSQSVLSPRRNLMPMGAVTNADPLLRHRAALPAVCKLVSSYGSPRRDPGRSACAQFLW